MSTDFLWKRRKIFALRPLSTCFYVFRCGVSGVHTHMTNSLNTPAEALEYAYPLRVTRYALRRGSGGAGQFRGGEGIVREIEVLGQ